MADLMRVSIFGNLPGGEEWSVNPVFALNDFPVTVTPTQALTVANAIAAIAANADMRSMVPSSVTFTGVRVEARTKAGVLETQAESLKGTPDAGVATVIHPYQTAWVSSLRTTHPGASGRGRLYWPAHGVALGASTFRVPKAVVDATNAGVISYLAAVEGAIQVTFPTVELAVWSRTEQALHIVNEIRMGDILDTQRRRRDQIVETYSSGTYGAGV